MGNKILVAYATNYGSTKEIAEFLSQVLRETGSEVEVSDVGEIKDLSAYQSLLLGSATRMGKLLSEAVKFAEKHKAALQEMKTAYFVVGATMKQDTPENREKATGFLRPLCELREPVGLGLFAGKIEHAKLGIMWRKMAQMDRSGRMEEGDFRDWEAIRAWAIEIAPALAGSSA